MQHRCILFSVIFFLPECCFCLQTDLSPPRCWDEESLQEFGKVPSEHFHWCLQWRRINQTVNAHTHISSLYSEGVSEKPVEWLCYVAYNSHLTERRLSWCCTFLWRRPLRRWGGSGPGWCSGSHPCNLQATIIENVATKNAEWAKVFQFELCWKPVWKWGGSRTQLEGFEFWQMWGGT